MAEKVGQNPKSFACQETLVLAQPYTAVELVPCEHVELVLVVHGDVLGADVGLAAFLIGKAAGMLAGGRIRTCSAVGQARGGAVRDSRRLSRWGYCCEEARSRRRCSGR